MKFTLIIHQLLCLFVPYNHIISGGRGGGGGGGGLKMEGRNPGHPSSTNTDAQLMQVIRRVCIFKIICDWICAKGPYCANI